MKKLKVFIQTEVLLPKLHVNGVLVAYDPHRRYRNLCLELAGAKRRVVDASESSILSREQALAALQELGKRNAGLDGLLVYVPAPAPQEDEERQRDPFAIYAKCGCLFPDGDGDEYLSLCLKARADHPTEIRRIFSENPNPDFGVIDAVGVGTSWPSLQAALQVESARAGRCRKTAVSSSRSIMALSPIILPRPFITSFRTRIGMKKSTSGSGSGRRWMAEMRRPSKGRYVHS